MTVYVKGESDLGNKGTLSKKRDLLRYNALNTYWQICDLDPFIVYINKLLYKLI